MWDQHKVQKLRELWSKGLSASKISEQIPGTTRNSIIGKSHRLGLESRALRKKTSVKVNTENNVKSEVKIQKLGRKARFKALLLDKNFPTENPVELTDLHDDLCRWPLGEKLEPAKLFCGRKPMQKFPYCQLHMLYGYQSRNEKDEDVITDEDIPKFIEKKIKSA